MLDCNLLQAQTFITAAILRNRRAITGVANEGTISYTCDYLDFDVNMAPVKKLR